MGSVHGTMSVAELRARVVAAQGYAPRYRRATADEVASTVERLSCVQLDSISTVARSHRIALTGRAGDYAAGTVSRLLGEGRIFEYWAHEACLLPIDDYPLHKWRMARYANEHPWYGDVYRRYPGLRERVLDEIRDRGPLASRHFEGRDDPGAMWGWKPAKQMLEALYSAGELAIAGRQGFQRLYDLAERVIPRDQLAAPPPTEEEFRRGFALRAIRARGALTEYGVSEHCRFRGGSRAIRPHLEALIADGVVRRVTVADGGAPVYVATDWDGGGSGAAALLSPFDNLLWDRPFLERVFGFRHVIEVYKREHERVYGYYVLPFLLGDRLVGRADLKAERREGVLTVRAFHLEPRVRDSKRLRDQLERALTRLARSIGLERVVL